MAVRDVEHLIIGGGVAAAKAAEGLRAAGGEGSAVVMTAEPELPYERPPLSKEFLRGEAGREKTRTHDEAWYRDHDVEVMLATRASTVDPSTRTVTTEIGDQLRYGGLVLATGATPVRLGLPGEERVLGGVPARRGRPRPPPHRPGGAGGRGGRGGGGAPRGHPPARRRGG